MLGTLGAFLWVLPTAQAEGLGDRTSATGMIGAAPGAALQVAAMQPNDVPLPQAPLTVAANATARAAGASSGNLAMVRGGKGPNCTGEVGDQSTVTVPLGKSTLVNLGEPVRQRTVGNPAIVQTMLVSPQTLYLLGSDIGTTNMIVQGKSGSCSVIDVVVGADPAGLQQTILKLMPNERGVQVMAAGDALVLTGTVSDATVAARIVELAHAFTARPNSALPPPSAHAAAAPAGAGPLPIPGLVPVGLGGGAAPALGGGADKSQRVINMMHIAAPQQVMLEVKVAEVSKTLIDQLGAQANLQGSIGTWSFGILAQFLSGGLGIAAASKANNLPLNLAIDAQKTDQLVKILAEPNLMAISGQEASFLAGGKVFIPVPQSNGSGGTTITLQEELFGVGLTFTPTVLENGRINLKVAPEVSELSPTGVAVSAGGVNSTAILPLITTRRATTTLQVYDGQSFAIGGLMKSNATGTIKALPGIGEVPVLGALFRSTNFQEDKTELVFIVTPRLAKPLPKAYPMPTDTFANVNEGMVYATGNMEGSKPVAPAAPAGVPARVPGTAPAVAPAPEPSGRVPAGNGMPTTQAAPQTVGAAGVVANAIGNTPATGTANLNTTVSPVAPLNAPPSPAPHPGPSNDAAAPPVASLPPQQARMEAPPDATQMTRTMATEEPRVDSQPLAAQVDTAQAPATPQ
ncbi:type II and III secretion system protein family protein [Paraburkholderia edwinii]|uniref:Type II and III secretion system protein family protein n=2 Tax=Paraburkholderia edwinii TaxID=2861782 RepID=A0ABX8V4D0_9BURK|nr:type II and III secretion system protein family protein [Paraburkholderia edwinii]QYD73930.1 type II and III secretion system protein family protein [Paraburkholderia edwinii]